MICSQVRLTRKIILQNLIAFIFIHHVWKTCTDTLLSLLRLFLYFDWYCWHFRVWLILYIISCVWLWSLPWHSQTFRDFILLNWNWICSIDVIYSLLLLKNFRKCTWWRWHSCCVRSSLLLLWKLFRNQIVIGCLMCTEGVLLC